MELVVNQELDIVPEPIVASYNDKMGLMNSNYKIVVKDNFQSVTTPSLFGIRQGLKAFQYNMVNHVAVILRLSVFAAVLIALF